MANFYTTRQAAKQAGVTRATVQAWIAAGLIKAPRLRTLGNVSARLWSKADIAGLRATKAKIKTGRPRKGARC